MNVKKIGFKENKPCRVCNLLAFYQVSDSTFCEHHMKGFLEFYDRAKKKDN